MLPDFKRFLTVFQGKCDYGYGHAVISSCSSEELRTNPHYEPIFEDCINASGSALEHPTMKRMLDNPKTKFDVVIAVYIVGHEAGYYLAERFHASLVLYFTAQLSIPTIDHAMGMPKHPALLPFGPTHFPLKIK